MSQAVDLDGLARRLRQLRPEAEKVIRMYFGLGCPRCHSAQEMAAGFGVTTVDAWDRNGNLWLRCHNVEYGQTGRESGDTLTGIVAARNIPGGNCDLWR